MNNPHLYSLEDEMSVLGAGFLDEGALFAAADGLSVEAFGEPRHQKIFVAFKALRGSGEPVDLVTVTRWLKEQGQLEQVGGAAYLATLVDYVPTAANVGYYIKKVKEYKQRRDLAQLAKRIEQQAASAESLDSLYSGVLADIQALSEGCSEKTIFYTLPQQADLYEEFVNQASRNRLATGFDDFDGVIRGGPAPGEVVVVVAQSGVGKSAFMHNCALNACSMGRRVIVFSIEMSVPRIFERTVQISREHYTYNVESGFHHHSGYREQTLKELADKGADRLLVCDLPSLTIEQVEHYTRLARSKYGEIHGIFIDYLGLMAADGAKSEYERISHISDSSIQLAKRLNLPVVLLSQVNRSSAVAGEIEKHSAKGGGGIESAAHLLLGLQKDDQGELILKVLKQRAGEGDLKFLVDVDWKFLKIRSIKPYDAIAAKNTKRGKDRFAKADYQQLQANDY